MTEPSWGGEPTTVRLGYDLPADDARARFLAENVEPAPRLSRAEKRALRHGGRKVDARLADRPYTLPERAPLPLSVAFTPRVVLVLVLVVLIASQLLHGH